MTMPLWDWQFFVVTAIAALAVWRLVRAIVPKRAQKDAQSQVTPAPASAACAHCASNPSAPQHARQQPSRTTTVPVVALRDLRETARQAKTTSRATR